jgi:hypothetical protein
MQLRLRWIGMLVLVMSWPHYFKAMPSVHGHLNQCRFSCAAATRVATTFLYEATALLRVHARGCVQSRVTIIRDRRAEEPHTHAARWVDH